MTMIRFAGLLALVLAMPQANAQDHPKLVQEPVFFCFHPGDIDTASFHISPGQCPSGDVPITEAEFNKGSAAERHVVTSAKHSAEPAERPTAKRSVAETKYTITVMFCAADNCDIMKPENNVTYPSYEACSRATSTKTIALHDYIAAHHYEGRQGEVFCLRLSGSVDSK